MHPKSSSRLPVLRLSRNLGLQSRARTMPQSGLVRITAKNLSLCLAHLPKQWPSLNRLRPRWPSLSRRISRQVMARLGLSLPKALGSGPKAANLRRLPKLRKTRGTSRPRSPKRRNPTKTSKSSKKSKKEKCKRSSSSSSSDSGSSLSSVFSRGHGGPPRDKLGLLEIVGGGTSRSDGCRAASEDERPSRHRRCSQVVEPGGHAGVCSSFLQPGYGN